MLEALKNLAARAFSKSAPPPRLRSLEAAYDLARTTTQNKNHWARADQKSINALNTPANRKITRDRCREEVANNSRLQGMVLTLRNDTIGTGPKLSIPSDPQAEAMFAEWARSVKLAEKLRTMRSSRVESGEVFAMLVTDRLAKRVPLNFLPFESEMVQDPWLEHYLDPLWDDGIQFDAAGNAISYRVLERHPGDMWAMAGWGKYNDIDARFIWHYFVPQRPGARRAVAEIISSAQEAGDLRRFDNATLLAAEAAASPGMVVETDLIPETGAFVGKPYEELPISHNMKMTLPAGSHVKQMVAEHPNANYDVFVDKKIAAAARCINMPFTIAALDSSNANLSARYLDSQIYVSTLYIERKNKLEDEFLEGFLLPEWWGTAYLYGIVSTPEPPPHEWHWDSITGHADPAKVASAQTERLANGTSNIPQEVAEDGGDWMKNQVAAAQSFGVSLEEYRALLRNRVFNHQQPQVSAGGDVQSQPDKTRNQEPE